MLKIASLWRRPRTRIRQPLNAPAQARRRNRRIERGLQAEIVLRLKAAGIFYIPIPNGVFLPVHTDAERIIARRIIDAMKSQGEMEPGAYDLVIFGANGRGGLVELKREAGTDMLGRKVTAGQLSQAQRTFRDRARAAGIPEAVCRSWNEVYAFWTTL